MSHTGKSVKLVLACLLIYCLEFGASILPNFNAENWNNYWSIYGYLYDGSGVSEAYRQYYYNYNTNFINKHNALFDRNLRTYRLAENQFTALRLRDFTSLFPQTTQPTQSFNSTPPAVSTITPVSYDPREQGFVFTVQDQGIRCNSGWAYASAKAVEILQANIMGDLAPGPLSAQNLIDCAGRSLGCTRQVPQAAFDYLTQYNQDLYLEADYPNNNTLAQQGMCIVPTETMPAPVVTNLAEYATLRRGSDEILKQYVAAGFPVVIEYNPTSFEFMHYAGGVFQQPATKTGSHFMPVIGYGNDTETGLQYWLAINSFGYTWGENGFIRIAQSAAKPLLMRPAIFPTELA